MRKIVYLFIAGLLLAAGCKIDDPGIALTGNTYNSYQPVSKGSFWKYTKTHVAVDGSQTETQTMTGSRNLINKNIYYTVRTQNATTDDTLNHYSHVGDDYTFRTTSNIGSVTVEYLYLKENAVVGQQWIAKVSDNGFVNGIPARIVGSIVEKNTTKTIGGKRFTNVMHTTLYFQYDQGAGFVTVEVIDYYIAKSIGIIEIDYSDGTMQTSQSVIADYDIK